MSGSLLAAYRTATPASSHQRHLCRVCGAEHRQVAGGQRLRSK